MRRIFVNAVMVVLVAGTVVYAAKFKSTWKAPDAGRLGFAGKKVAALVITDDQNLQIAAEESLARELNARGVQGVAAYRLIPKEELRDKDKAKGWFERASVAGIVIMRVVSAEKEITYTPDVWLTTMYADPWNYYGYGWSTAIGGVTRREDTVVTIETLIYDLPKSKLMWAGVSEKTNPKGTQQVVKDLVAEVVKEMRKDGLVPPGAK
jgi:hypothetical protein